MFKDRTARAFSAEDVVFRKACELAGIAPSRRQASKWSNSRGVAFPKRLEAYRELREEGIIPPIGETMFQADGAVGCLCQLVKP